jgi:hypothetical protein
MMEVSSGAKRRVEQGRDAHLSLNEGFKLWSGVNLYNETVRRAQLA